MTSTSVGGAYDARAEEYIRRFGRVDLAPTIDQALVARWRNGTAGLLLDVGCGPGHWTDFLHDPHHQALGVDVSAQFLAHAQASYPATRFLRAAMEALPLQPASVGGILAWFSVIHTPPDQLPSVVTELRRVLEPGGSLLLGFVDGVAAEQFAHSVHPAYYWSTEALADLLSRAGLVVRERYRRHDEGQRAQGALIAHVPVTCSR